MTHSTDPQDTFSALLQSEVEQTQRLFDLLRQEYKILQLTSPDTLEQLTEEKRQQIEQLETAVSELNRYLVQQGFSPDQHGTQAFLEHLPENAQARNWWEKLQTLLENCHKQNLINGAALSLSQRQVSNSLDLLRGVTGAQKTYGPAGESRPNHRINSLGMA